MADDTTSAVAGGLFGAATSIATGNPFGAALAIGGMGLSIFGAVSKANIEAEKTGVQTQMTQTELAQDRVRREAMRLGARRQQMEVLRNAQRAKSLALNNATSQGAQFGSGLQGGYGQIAGAANWNNQGIAQNLNFGEQMFDLNAQLSQQKLQMAKLGGQSATASSIGSLGGTLLSSAPHAKNVSGTIGGMFGGGGSSSGNIIGPSGGNDFAGLGGWS